MTAQRIISLRNVFAKENVDSFLVTNFFNILYLSGVKTLVPEEREAFMLITKDHTYFFTDARYDSEELHTKLGNIQAELRLIKAEKRLMQHLEEIVKEENLTTMVFEEEDIKFYEYRQLTEKVKNVKIVPFKQFILSMRAQKSSEEVDAVRKACSAADKCLEDFSKMIKVGITEKELAWKMEVWIREHGYELGFDPLICVDENSAIPHYDTKTGHGVVKENSILLVDYGVKYENYVSDTTRMFFMGNQPQEVITTYNSLLKAQQKSVDFLAKGKELKAVDSFCRESLMKENLPDFPHSTGHGVGLEVHEFPKLSYYSHDVVQPNQIVTVEPGVYYKGKYGMRIEDTIWIDNDYSPHILTNFTKDFFQL